MTNHVVTLFILFTCLISGCEDTTAITQMTIDPEKVTKEQEQVKEATKNKPVFKQATIPTQKKPPQSKIEKTPDLTDPSQNQPVLDLSIPQTSEIIIAPTTSDNTPNYKEREYLPDLFSDKKNQKNDAVQIDGKIITRDEMEIDKQRTPDGVGIDIKLTP